MSSERCPSCPPDVPGNDSSSRGYMSSDFFEGYTDRMVERIERALGGPEASKAYDYWGFGGGEGRDARLTLDGGFTSDELGALGAALAQAIDEEERWRCGIE